MNHRLALAQRFAPRIPDTARTYAPAGETRDRYRRALGRQRGRVGATPADELYLNPSDLVLYYRQIFDKDPSMWTLGFIIFSVGQRLADVRMHAAEVEAVGGGSLQLRLELDRRVEDWQGLVWDFKSLVRGSVDPSYDWGTLGSEASFATSIARRLFIAYPQDQGLFDYEAGGGISQLPPPRGLIWELGTLMNQTWAMWHPIAWIGDDPDEPWWSWLPVAIAAGWVEAVNEVQSIAADEPTQGPGWGAEIGHAAEQTEAKVVELGEKGASVIGALAKSAAMAGIGLGLLALVIMGSRRR